MFAKIKLNGANTILINIPSQGADKSIPALVSMLENNAIFLEDGYFECSIKKPETTIILGNSYRTDTDKPEIQLSSSPDIISEDFVIESPEVHVSMKKLIEKYEKELKTVRLERDTAKAINESLQAKIDKLIDNTASDNA